VRAEYREMPGLCLIHAQAARLLDLDVRELLGGRTDVVRYAVLHEWMKDL
jgi:hypothetical protein